MPVASSLKTLQILVVEDHADTLTVLKAMLESLGHRAAGASTLAAGRAVLKSSKIDVVFSDLQLPDGMGWDLLSGLDLPPGFVAVAMSGHLDSFHDKIQQAGFCHRIDKPVSIRDLETALSRHETLARAA